MKSTISLLNHSKMITDRMFYKLSLFVWLLWIIPIMAHAQGRHQEVTIIAPFQPSLSDVIKLELRPEIPDTLVRTPEIRYSINPIAYPTRYELMPLKPVYLHVDPPHKLHRNYLQLGYGNYSTPYVSFFSNTLRSSKYAAGFAFQHYSSSGSLKNHPVSAFSNNHASLYGSRNWTGKTLGAEINYSRNVVHYYGVVPDVDSSIFSLKERDLKQRFSLIDSRISLRNSGKNNPRYHASLDFYLLEDLYAAKETGISLDGNFRERSKILYLTREEEWQIKGGTDLYLTRDTLETIRSVMVHLNPSYHLISDFVDVRIGVNPTIAVDSVARFRIYPDMGVSFRVIPEHLKLYLEVSGRMQRNTMRTISQQNPWMNPIFPYDYSSIKYDFSGGLTGKMAAFADFNFRVSFAEIKSLLLFINDFQSPFRPGSAENYGNKFTAVYDEARLTTFLAEVSMEISSKLKSNASVRFYNYQLEREEYPWHRPSYDATLKAIYKATPKIHLTGEFFYVGGSWAKREYLSGSYSVEKLDGYLDLNVGGEYSIKDWVGAFIYLNNFSGARYYRWYAYPSQRLNVLGGLKIAL